MPRASTAAQVYPAALKQQFMLGQIEHPDCPDDLRDRWILRHAFLIKPRLDMRRFKRAYQKLVARHDLLRLQFFRCKGAWMARIDPKGPEVFREIDLGDVSDAVFWEKLKALANAPMPLVDAPLAEMLVLRCGTRGDVVMLRIHHTITDGIGMIVLTEDLMKLIIGVPILGKAVSFADYLARFHLPSPRKAAEVRAFWEEMHADFPKTPMMGRKAKGLPPLVTSIGEIEQREMTFHLSPDSVVAFEIQAKAANIKANTILTAGFTETLCQLYGLEKLMFMTHVGRTEPALATFIGDHTRDIVLPYRRSGADKLADGAVQLGETLSRAMAHLPSPVAYRDTPHEAALIADGCFPAQISVLQPRAVARQEKSDLAEMYFAEFGQELRIGRHTTTMLDVGQNNRIVSELQFNLEQGRTRTHTKMLYDGLAYTDDEVARMGETLCDLTGLKLLRVDVA